MTQVRGYSKEAVKRTISTTCGFGKNFKNPNILSIKIYEETEKSCLLAVEVELTEKSTGRRSIWLDFQVWAKIILLGWVQQKEASNIYQSYLRHPAGGYYPTLYDLWADRDPVNEIKDIAV